VIFITPHSQASLDGISSPLSLASEAVAMSGLTIAFSLIQNDVF
jgi:hypothetical protein